MIIGKRDKDLLDSLREDRAKKIAKISMLELNNDVLSEKLDEVSNILEQTLTKLNQIMGIDFEGFAKKYNLTYKELANVCNVSLGTLNKYRKDPTIMTPKRFREVYGRLLIYQYELKHK